VEVASSVKKAVCIFEKLQSSDTKPFVIQFNSTDDKDQTITLDNIKEFFGNNLTCPMTSASLYKDSPDVEMDETLSPIVSIDPSSYLITVKNNVKTSQTLNFVIKGKTAANAYGFKDV